ncbi:MAG TPA: NAD(P)/FAD-dependent oxidoreductase [Polyangiaceae bacterium]|nr:NAD(P)/FAD-dependent oxidoreductase [Polyangiaceae bacterium]
MDRKLVIIGGGVAGLSAGCYALRSGFRTTIVEHNLALGGVCTAWQRGRYTIDGCIHWLTGGPFEQVYRELDILPAVKLRPLHTWATYRDASSRTDVPFTCDLDAFTALLIELSPEDEVELARLREGAAKFLAMKPPIDAPELRGPRDWMRAAWEMRDAMGAMVHFRKPIGQWASEHLSSQRLRRMFTCMLPETTPTLFLLMVLGYLEQGYLSRPIGGTHAFRRALEATYRKLGGEAIMNATVDEVLVEADHARGVRLADGTVLPADVVISTASAPETVLRLLGGRYDADKTRERLDRWKLFEPIVLASFGVAKAYTEYPSTLVIDGIEPFDVGGRRNDHLYVRVYNDDASFAPLGHTVVQAMLSTDYDWWATLGTRYNSEKDAMAELVLEKLGAHFPGIRLSVRATDIATPLTYWTMARSWRGAFEGWMPSSESLFGHVSKKLRGLDGFYMAGQWVEPGGGIPTAALSGRHAIQLVCADHKRPFVSGR